MGFMTEISIRNDAWHEFEKMIREDPETFISEMRVLMNGHPRYHYNPETDKTEYQGSDPVGEIKLPGHVGYSDVYVSHHADDPRLYYAGQNSFQALDPYIIESEYGVRLYNENMLDALDRQVATAERLLKETKTLLKKKREELEAREAGVGS